MGKNKLECWEELSVDMRPKVRYWLPAAAMDENDLREEIRCLRDRGFGGVEVVVLSSLPEVIARSEDGWGTPGWDRMVAVIAEETRRLGMSMDIANGPGWPVSAPGIESADDPAALCELTFGVADAVPGQRYSGALPRRRVCHEEGEPVLVHALAYLEKKDRVLVQDSYTDLMPYVSGGHEENILEYEFPEAAGRWKVFAFYRQPAVHKTNSGQCYVVDHLSKAGVSACARYWDGVFAHYEKEQVDLGSLESFFCDSLEYQVSLDWTPLLPEEFSRRRGYSILPYLPFIGLDNLFPPCDVPGYVLEDCDISEMINRDYMETLTQCYCENHLEGLQEMAEKYGKSIRYQVAYNKPFEVERCPLYVELPENEALGRPSVDYQKTMAAAAHLGRKKRYSFECAAEFGNSYGQNYEDLFWWVKRSLMAGMNAQVLHGASYSGGYRGSCSVNGRMPGTEWPGYEGFGKFVSNYWNRTLSVPDARGCMDAVARLNTLFRKQARVDCAVFKGTYSSDGLGGELCLYQDDGVLSNRGYSYEFLSEALLRLPVCTVKNHVLDEEGVGYKCLIIPQQRSVSCEFLDQAGKLMEAGLPVVWVGEKPVCGKFYGEWDTEEKRILWGGKLEAVWNAPGLIHADSLKQVPILLEESGVLPEVKLEGKMDVMTAVRTDTEENRNYFALYGYNRAEYSPDDLNTDELACSAVYRRGTIKGSYERPGAISRRRLMVKLKGRGRIWLCDPWSGEKLSQEFTYDGKGYMSGWAELEEDEMLIFVMEPDANITDAEPVYPVCLETLSLESFEPDTPGGISFLRSGFVPYGGDIRLEPGKLLPWRQLDPALEHFAGRGIYRGYADVEKLEKGRRYILELGEVCDTFTVHVNGQQTSFPDQVMKRADITELLREGRNELEIMVVSNLYNRLFHENMDSGRFQLSYLPRDYGVWESQYKRMGIRAI